MAIAGRVDAGHSPGKLTSELLDRLPPHNLDAEKGVLGSLLIDPQLCDDVILLLRAEDFYSDANRRLFEHIVAMHDEGSQLDATLLVERLSGAGAFEAIGGSAYLAEVMHSVPVAAHAVHYAEIVRDKATLRDLIHAGTEIIRDAWDPEDDPDEVVSSAEQKIFAVHDQRSRDQLANIHDVLVEAFKRIDARLEHGEGVGIPSGFTDLDNLTGGLHDSELVILAARPSMGKTALATNIAEHVSIESNVTTLFVSLEMARLELAQRMLASLGKIDSKKFRARELGRFLSGEDHEKIAKVSASLGKAPLFIDDSPSRSVAQIAACGRRLKRKVGLGLIIIDYLQLIQPDNPKDPRQEQVAKIARRLKGLARELELPVLCLAQLNRQAEAGRDSHRPRLSHLRESGAIEQDADVVMFIHREEVYQTREEAREANTAGVAELIIAKQRNGPTDNFKLAWFEDFTRFENYAPEPYEEFADSDSWAD